MRAPFTGLVTPLFALAAILSLGCNDTLGPSVGTLDVTVSTTGVDVDADGYIVTVAGTTRQVANNASVVFTGIPPGEYPVVVDGVDPNCSVTGNNQLVKIATTRPSRVSLAVTCILRTGGIRVAITTTGADLDSDGYGIAVDAGAERPIVPIAANATLIVDGVRAGSHAVDIGGVAGNCRVVGESHRVVVVPFGGAIVDVAFGVTCVASGTLTVTVATTGVNLDADGFAVVVRRSGFDAMQDVRTSGTVTFSPLLEADYIVTLSGVAANCDVTGVNPRTATVTGGATTGIQFDVVCATLTQLAFAKTIGNNTDIWTINADGTGAVRLTTITSEDAAPAWSPDGSKIAFRSTRDGNSEIYVMAADGSGVTRLGQSIAGRPSWSPDGRKIAFASRRDGAAEIYVMNADGSGLVQLTSNTTDDVQPAWSPDGQLIAFTSNRDGNNEIYVMKPDGSAVRRLTSNTIDDGQPAWSPDSKRIAFTRLNSCDYYSGCDNDIFAMNADGSGQAPLLSGSGNPTEPTWSPDGRKIAFTLFTCDYYCYQESRSLMVMKADGTNVVELTSGSVFNPSWRW